MPNEKLKLSQLSYKNAEIVKMGDRHLGVWKQSEGYLIEFKVLTNDFEPRAVHRVKRNKIVSTCINVTEVSAYALYLALQTRLKKEGII